MLLGTYYLLNVVNIGFSKKEWFNSQKMHRRSSSKYCSLLLSVTQRKC